MRRLALAATLVAATACNPPPYTEDAVPASENAVRAPVVRMAAATKPVLVDGDPVHLVTTTTVPPPPTTVAPTTTSPPAPPVTAAAPSPVGECGGWEGLVASLWPADQVATSCRILACESNGNPHARNPSGASGLYQIMPLWAEDYERVTGLPYYDGRFNGPANATFARWLWGQSGWRPWSCA